MQKEKNPIRRTWSDARWRAFHEGKERRHLLQMRVLSVSHPKIKKGPYGKPLYVGVDDDTVSEGEGDFCVIVFGY
jgi:hypothetical protein